MCRFLILWCQELQEFLHTVKSPDVPRRSRCKFEALGLKDLSDDQNFHCPCNFADSSAQDTLQNRRAMSLLRSSRQFLGRTRNMADSASQPSPPVVHDTGLTVLCDP